ncbi:hypothetical protein [Rothia sp. P4278]|uniref:hypothetical protein n=1 Tax=Rothia sp. P4278 TaxID=3402658 RepID=UPI003AD963E8
MPNFFTKHCKKLITAIVLPLAGISIAVSFNLISITLSPHFNIAVTAGEPRTTQGSSSSQLPSAESLDSIAPAVDSKDLAVGTCLNAGSAAPCDTTHNQEVVSQRDTCSMDHFYTYTAGNKEYDIPAPEVSVEKSNESCIATFPARSSSIKNIWNILNYSPEIDPLRACYAGSQASQKIVSCGQPHLGEVVYQQADSASESLNCEDRANSYMGTSTYMWRDDLKVVDPAPVLNGSRYCILETRNNKPLESQLRNLKINKIITG